MTKKGIVKIKVSSFDVEFDGKDIREILKESGALNLPSESEYSVETIAEVEITIKPIKLGLEGVYNV